MPWLAVSAAACSSRRWTAPATCSAARSTRCTPAAPQPHPPLPHQPLCPPTVAWPCARSRPGRRSDRSGGSGACGWAGPSCCCAPPHHKTPQHKQAQPDAAGSARSHLSLVSALFPRPWNCTPQPLQLLQALSGCQVDEPGLGACPASLMRRLKNSDTAKGGGATPHSMVCKHAAASLHPKTPFLSRQRSRSSGEGWLRKRLTCSGRACRRAS